MVSSSGLEQGSVAPKLPPHLQMNNPPVNELGSHGSRFTQFASLPKELRMKVWNRELRSRQRLVKVTLKDAIGCDQVVPPSTNSTVPPDSPITLRRERPNGERFYAYIDGHRILSKYLRVCHESREETFRFYRVPLPCRLYTRDEGATPSGATPSLLHLNPEHDILYFKPEWSVRNTLFDCLFHMKSTYDPKQIGVRNLAIDCNSLAGNDLYLLHPHDIDPAALQATRAILQNLEEVYFVSFPRTGRQFITPEYHPPHGSPYWNRSLPIMARSPFFERFVHDPRDICEDLTRISLGMSDLHGIYQPWRRFWDTFADTEAGFSAGRTKPQYHFLTAFDPAIGTGEGVLDREEGESFLRQEEFNWTNDRGTESSIRFLGHDNVKWPRGATPEEYAAEDKRKYVRPAFGYWIFGIEGFVRSWEEMLEDKSKGDGGENTDEPIPALGKQWPELGLMSLG